MKGILVIGFGLFVSSVLGQARPADVSSPDSITVALYETLSGPAGDRDWDRFRNLFADGATVNSIRNVGSMIPFRHGSIEDYIEGTKKILAVTPFYEYEIGRETQDMIDFIQVFSGFECDIRGAKQYGVNEIQMAYFENRWWVVHLTFNVRTKEDVYTHFGIED